MKCLLDPLGGAVVLKPRSACAGMSGAHGRSSLSPTDFNLSRFLVIKSLTGLCLNVRITIIQLLASV